MTLSSISVLSSLLIARVISFRSSQWIFSPNTPHVKTSPEWELIIREALSYLSSLFVHKYSSSHRSYDAIWRIHEKNSSPSWRHNDSFPFHREWNSEWKNEAFTKRIWSDSLTSPYTSHDCTPLVSLQELLVSQLTDQRLYYEKLIAQNTVHLLESGHHIPSTVERIISPHGQLHHRHHSPFALPPNSDSMQWAEHADQELETIENIKLDISGKLPWSLSSYSLNLTQVLNMNTLWLFKRLGQRFLSPLFPSL